MGNAILPLKILTMLVVALVNCVAAVAGLGITKIVVLLLILLSIHNQQNGRGAEATGVLILAAALAFTY